MATTIDISAIARVIDQASGPLKAIQGAIGAVSDTAQKTGTSFAALGKAGAFGGLAQNIKNVGSAFARLGNQLSGVLGPVAGLVGLAGIGGAVASMKDYISTTRDLARAATSLGISAEEVQKFRVALGGAETADLGLRRLQKTLAGVAGGAKASAPALQLLEKFGITLKDVQNSTLADLLPKIADGFQRNQNPMTRARMALALFGREGQKLIPFLTQGSAGLAAMGEKAAELGIITNKQVTQGAAAARAWREMDTALLGVRNAIGAELLPVLTPLITQFRDWIVANREWLAAGIGDAIKSLGETLKAIDWQGIGRAIRNIGRAFAWVAERVGGWETVIAGVVALMNAQLVGALLNVGLAIGKLAISFATALPAITAFIGPWGLLAAAVAAAALAIYSNWDTIGPWLDGVVNGIKTTLAGARDAFETFLVGVTPEPVQSAWSSFAQSLAAAMEPVKAGLAGAGDAFSAFLGRIDALFAGLGPAYDSAIAALTGAWGRLPNFFSGLWDSIGGAFASASTLFAGLGSAYDSAIAALTGAWGRLPGFFSGLWDSIGGLFASAYDTIKGWIDRIVAAIEPLLGAVRGVGGAISSAAGAVGRFFGVGGGAAPDAATAPIAATAAPAGLPATAAAAPNLLQAAAGVQPQAQRSEIEQTLRVDLSPGLIGRLTGERTRGAPVRTEVDVGMSMGAAMGEAA